MDCDTASALFYDALVQEQARLFEDLPYRPRTREELGGLAAELIVALKAKGTPRQDVEVVLTVCLLTLMSVPTLPVPPTNGEALS